MRLFELPLEKEDCLAISPRAKSLTRFATLCNVVGIIFASLIIVATIIIDIILVATQNTYLGYSVLNVLPSDSVLTIILVNVIGLLLAFIVYIVWHFKASLLNAAAQEVQNTYVTANIAAYNEFYGKEEVKQAEPKHVEPIVHQQTVVEPVVEEKAMPKDVCPNCGNKITDEDIFCTRCGTKVK